jgi:hypothetical protein
VTGQRLGPGHAVLACRVLEPDQWRSCRVAGFGGRWRRSWSGTSNGPTDAINGRLEHLRGSALGFRNLTNYIARSLVEFPAASDPTTPSIVKSRFTSPG